MARIKTPIFGSSPVPFGRMADVLGQVANTDRCAWLSSGLQFDAGYFLYRFPTRVDALAKVREDQGKAAPCMGCAKKDTQEGWKIATANP